MIVEILPLIEGSKKAKGCVVIIDVLRAFSVEALCFDKGCKYIIPVGTVEECLKLHKSIPNSILIGERHGIKLDGFDYGNSPYELKDANLKDKIIIHTTSSGTQGVKNAINADVILAGNLLNAKAIANYIKSNNYEYVSLVPMGKEGLVKTKEDTICAKYLKALLLDQEYDIDSKYEEIKNDDGLKFFSNNPSFPEYDFHYCIRHDIYNFVMILEKKDKYNIFRKII